VILGLLLAAALVALAVSHVALLVALARAQPSLGVARVMLAVILPPLVPWWSFERGYNRRVLAWLGALGVYVVALVGTIAR